MDEKDKIILKFTAEKKLYEENEQYEIMRLKQQRLAAFRPKSSCVDRERKDREGENGDL